MTILGIIGPWQIVLIVLAILLLFGGKKIPELMKGMGKGVRAFKDGMNEPSSPDEPAAKAEKATEERPAAPDGATAAPLHDEEKAETTAKA